MTWALVAALVVLVASLAVLARQVTASRASARAATRSVEEAKAQVDSANQRSRETAEALRRAQVETTEARQATEQAVARAELAESGLAFRRQEAASSAAKAHLEALWGLACLEQGRAWRLTMALPQDSSPAADAERAEDSAGPNTLRRVMDREIERIREETGTPGQLSTDLPQEPAAGDAIVILRALQGLLAILARYSDAFDLHLSADDDQVVAALTCEGFDGPDTVADEATSLLRALGPTQAEIDVERDDAGRLAARLTVPLMD